MDLCLRMVTIQLPNPAWDFYQKHISATPANFHYNPSKGQEYDEFSISSNTAVQFFINTKAKRGKKLFVHFAVWSQTDNSRVKEYLLWQTLNNRRIN